MAILPRAPELSDHRMPRTIRFLFALLTITTLSSCVSEGVFVPQIENTNFDTSLGVDLAASTRTSTGLYYRDLIVGTGAQVPQESGTSVTVAYSGYLRSGALFDSGTLPPFATGSNSVIAGFDEGVRGMRVGGRRQLIIPPALGYGAQEAGSIPANSILVFVVDLTRIN